MVFLKLDHWITQFESFHWVSHHGLKAIHSLHGRNQDFSKGVGGGGLTLSHTNKQTCLSVHRG